MMTEIMYDCKGENGEHLITRSLPTANEFVATYGGTFLQIEKVTSSKSEPYCMKNHRTIIM